MPLVKIVFRLVLLIRHHSALVAPLSQINFTKDMLLVAGYWLLVACCWLPVPGHSNQLLTIIYRNQ